MSFDRMHSLARQVTVGEALGAFTASACTPVIAKSLSTRLRSVAAESSTPKTEEEEATEEVGANERTPPLEGARSA